MNCWNPFYWMGRICNYIRLEVKYRELPRVRLAKDWNKWCTRRQVNASQVMMRGCTKVDYYRTACCHVLILLTLGEHWNRIWSSVCLEVFRYCKIVKNSCVSISLELVFGINILHYVVQYICSREFLSRNCEWRCIFQAILLIKFYLTDSCTSFVSLSHRINSFFNLLLSRNAACASR